MKELGLQMPVNKIYDPKKPCLADAVVSFGGDVKKKIMMVVGACIFLIAAAQALPMFFGIGA